MITADDYNSRMIEVGFALLHDGVIVGGKNLTSTLDCHHLRGLVMQYDKAEKELHVTWNNQTMLLPSTNIKGYVPGVAKDRRIVQSGSPQVASIAHAQVETPSTRVQNPSPQVETPMSHVHKGKGHGKTGQTK